MLPFFLGVLSSPDFHPNLVQGVEGPRAAPLGGHVPARAAFSHALPYSYVSLCDNEKTGCKARELKSVYVDAVGQFLKLILHQNHVNKYNVYNQVGPRLPTLSDPLRTAPSGGTLTPPGAAAGLARTVRPGRGQ